MWLRFSPEATAAEMFRETCRRPSKSQRRAGFFGPCDVEVLFDALDADDCFFGGPVFVAVDEESGSVGCDAEGFLHDADAS